MSPRRPRGIGMSRRVSELTAEGPSERQEARMNTMRPKRATSGSRRPQGLQEAPTSQRTPQEARTRRKRSP